MKMTSSFTELRRKIQEKSTVVDILTLSLCFRQTFLLKEFDLKEYYTTEAG